MVRLRKVSHHIRRCEPDSNFLLLSVSRWTGRANLGSKRAQAAFSERETMANIHRRIRQCVAAVISRLPSHTARRYGWQVARRVAPRPVDRFEWPEALQLGGDRW